MDTESVARLRSAISRIARQLNVSSTAEGLTPSQSSVLAVVATRGPLPLSELAEVEGLNPTMLSRIVTKLDELRLIDRAPDPDDMRSARVEITASGAKMHQRIRTLRTSAVSECLERLPTSTSDSLAAALPALEALAAELRSNDTNLAR
jgi:DNA-binding MarR family transcriptional regulator